jgi:signal transduction histidine kinase
MSSEVETVSMLGLRERRRLERDLHDRAQQRLVSLALTLRLAREKLGPDAGEAGRLLGRSCHELDEALKELRELARGIHPTVLSDRGLGAAVEALAHRAPLPVDLGRRDRGRDIRRRLRPRLRRSRGGCGAGRGRHDRRDPEPTSRR